MRSYGQFCPVAKAAEIFAERWTPLIIRELLMGGHRFSELEAGLPRISRALLAQRLRALERAEIIERRSGAGRGPEYHLTTAGQELYGVIERLGEWGQRWVNHDVQPEEIDTELLMWDMRRRIHQDRLPDRRLTVQFDFTGLREGSYWLLLSRGEVSVCLTDPGFDVDLLVIADTLALHRVWIGRQPLANALQTGQIELVGPTRLSRAFPTWLKLGTFANTPSAHDV